MIDAHVTKEPYCGCARSNTSSFIVDERNMTTAHTVTTVHVLTFREKKSFQ